MSSTVSSFPQPIGGHTCLCRRSSGVSPAQTIPLSWAWLLASNSSTSRQPSTCLLKASLEEGRKEELILAQVANPNPCSLLREKARVLGQVAGLLGP